MTFMNPVGILVVDDHRATRQSLCLLLRDVGYACSGAASAADARVLLDVDSAVPRPAVVILDLWMPHEDGESLLRWIRAQAHLAGVCVIIYSAAPASDHADRLVAAGAGAFLPKPTPVPRLLSLIAHHAGISAADMTRLGVAVPTL